MSGERPELTVSIPPELIEAIARRAAELVERSEERWLSKQEITAHFGVSPNTILNWMRAGMPYEPAGSRPIFKASKCDAWLAARSGRAYDRVGSTNGSGTAVDGPLPGHQEVGPDAS